MVDFVEVRLPTDIGYGSSGGPTWSTAIVERASGHERRNQNWSRARLKFNLSYTVRSADRIAVLLAFFRARRGRAQGFRLRDPSDWTSAANNVAAPAFDDQQIGTGDGTTVAFQLRKSYATPGDPDPDIREIAKPVVGSVRVGVEVLDGLDMVLTEQASPGWAHPWSVDAATGIVTFTVPPVAGAAVTAGFEFDVPVRFDTDELAIVEAVHEGREIADLPIIEIRPC